jgi:hypothetical protein
MLKARRAAGSSSALRGRTRSLRKERGLGSCVPTQKKGWRAFPKEREKKG